MAGSGLPASGDELPSSCFSEYEFQCSLESFGYPKDCGEDTLEVSAEQSSTALTGAWIDERVPTEAEGSARPEHHDRCSSMSLVQSTTSESPAASVSGQPTPQEVTSGAELLVAARLSLPASGLHRTIAGVLLPSSDVQRPIAIAVTAPPVYNASTDTRQSSNTAGSGKLPVPRVATSSPRASNPKSKIPCTEQDCKVTFGRKSDLQRHLDKVHLHSSERYECGAATCGYRTPRKDKMDEHVRNAGGDHVGREARVRVVFGVSRSTSFASSTGNGGRSTISTDE